MKTRRFEHHAIMHHVKLCAFKAGPYMVIGTRDTHNWFCRSYGYSLPKVIVRVFSRRCLLQIVWISPFWSLSWSFM